MLHHVRTRQNFAASCPIPYVRAERVSACPFHSILNSNFSSPQLEEEDDDYNDVRSG